MKISTQSFVRSTRLVDEKVMHIDDTENNINSLKNNMYEYNYTDSGVIVRSDASFVELEFLFQPIIDLKQRQVRHLEILSKVLSDSGEICYNETFFSEIDQEFIKMVALAQIKFCSDLKVHIPITVNMTLSCLKDRFFLQSLLNERDVNFDIEITDIDCDVNCGRLQSSIRLLKRSGVGLLLDDYYHKNNVANISLGFIDWDYIKIDKSFLHHNCDDINTINYLLRVISPYAKKGIILEGVETSYQHDVVKNLNVLVQGYFYSPPVSWTQLKRKMNIMNKEHV
ncbi:EAL domain-containing protein [Vibrio fortis]|uniref:EAL domain-containing protein n=1 Tax=Vibrio fortis TaxID=212667 RepID=UPI0021C466B5|nr:EAL domain-containing protein [Vibrio fortis]